MISRMESESRPVLDYEFSAIYDVLEIPIKNLFNKKISFKYLVNLILKAYFYIILNWVTYIYYQLNN